MAGGNHETPLIDGTLRGDGVATIEKTGDFSLVLGVKKEKKPAPQASAAGREGTGKE